MCFDKMWVKAGPFLAIAPKVLIDFKSQPSTIETEMCVNIVGPCHIIHDDDAKDISSSLPRGSVTGACTNPLLTARAHFSEP